MQDKQSLRQLILSNNPDSVELGLILNERFKLFPQTARFYKKNKRCEFWKQTRFRSVLETETRYWALSAVLNAELHTYTCSFWLDYNFKTLTPWQLWQNRITIGLPTDKHWTISRKYFGHPYTEMFTK